MSVPACDGSPPGSIGTNGQDDVPDVRIVITPGEKPIASKEAVMGN